MYAISISGYIDISRHFTLIEGRKPMMVAGNGANLYVEEAGSGIPILFIHEFGGNYNSWEPQMRYFSRRYRCVTYAARGYPPSDIPTDPQAYSQDMAVADAVAVMDGLGLERAHVVGLSMGGFTTVHMGLKVPERCLSLTIAGAGYGCEPGREAYFRDVSLKVADNFEQMGAGAFAPIYGQGASRVQFQNKDPRGWNDFVTRLATHSTLGAALTMRGVQAHRPSFHELERELSRMDVPALIMNGDEDDHCLLPGLFLKRVLPAAGLAVLPKTGHTLNLEEPDLFNTLLAEFLAQVEAGQWTKRDPRARPDQVMKTLD
ncbi:Putative esterase ytxM [Gluconacetobacter sp. SXCC-1]|nr:alpha/beta hydrolase [Komagataeibacter xylinus]EGG76752.1 Putative esterase ytxM [Gluconacetobacter sp. SXCC-1]